ncbi:MAG: carboxypeptidase regulatory-like domain-containing protein [Ignavibacteria bacterium]|nr:carboxypeptidase regulatory-like domain-containing protein [Ignavibacteria bacterium]
MKSLVTAFFVLLAFLAITACENIGDETTNKNNFQAVLVDEQDIPVPNAIVEVFRTTLGKTNILVSEEIICIDTTDEDGNFELKNLPSSLNNLKIRIRHSDFKKFEESLDVLFKNQSKEKIRLRILHKEECCGKIIIYTLGPDSSKLSNVSVKLNRKDDVVRKSKTNEDGKLVFENVCQGQYWFRLSKDGYEVVEKEFTIGKCDTLEFTFVLNRKSSFEKDTCCKGILGIEVKNQNGEILNGALVYLRKESKVITKQVVKDNQAVYFKELCPGSYSLLIQKSGYSAAEVDVTLQCNDSVFVSSTLYRDTCCNGKIAITVKDKENNPISDAKVIIWLGKEKIGYTTTNSNGFALFENLCQGTYSLSIQKDGYQTIEFTVELGCNEEKEFSKTFQRKETNQDSCCFGILKIFVKDKSSNQYVNGALVKMWKKSEILKTAEVTEGVALFKNICPGSYSFSIHKEGYKTIEFTLTFECNDTLEATKYLEKTILDSCCNGKLILIVKDTSNNQPIKGAEVKLWKGSTKVGIQSTNENGKVVFEKLCEGDYSVSIYKSGYSGKEFSFDIGCDQTIEKHAYLKQKGTDTCCTAVLKLRIINSSNNEPISGAKVVIKDGETTLAEITSDSEGWAIKEKLCAPKNYSVRVSAEGFQAKEFTITFKECNVIKETIKLSSQ